MTKPEQPPPITQVVYKEEANLCRKEGDHLWLQCSAMIMPRMVLKPKKKGCKQVRHQHTDGSLEVRGNCTGFAVNDTFTVEITTTEPQQVAERIKDAWKPILITLQPVTDLEWQPARALFDNIDLPALNPQDVTGLTCAGALRE